MVLRKTNILGKCMGTIEKALNRQKEINRHDSNEGFDEAVLENSKPKESSTLLYDNGANTRVQAESVSEYEHDILSRVSDKDMQVSDTKEERRSQDVEVDLERLKDMGFITSLDSRNLLSEEIREIKRPLLQNIKGKGAHQIDRANLIQVTSSVQGEGKTFTSINLAMAFAMEMDYRVLLVDADVIKSSVSKTMGIKAEQGLTDYLQGQVSDLSKVLLKTNIPKLSILPAGSIHELSSELLNSEFMDNLINELSNRYKDRIVIIDSPPILETNESRIIAHKVGQIVFVIEHNKTTQTNIKSALSLLDPEMVIGLVLNKNRSATKSSYYYGYGADA